MWKKGSTAMTTSRSAKPSKFSMPAHWHRLATRLPWVDVYRRRLVPCLEELGERPGALRRSEHEDVLDPARLRRILRLVEEQRRRHQEAGPRVRELLGELIGRVQWID